MRFYLDGGGDMLQIDIPKEPVDYADIAIV